MLCSTRQSQWSGPAKTCNCWAEGCGIEKYFGIQVLSTTCTTHEVWAYSRG